MSLNHLFVSESKNVFKNHGDMSEVYRKWSKGNPTGQIRKNLNIKINNEYNRL